MALAGATGSGKSSIFNALAGIELALTSADLVGLMRGVLDDSRALVELDTRVDRMLEKRRWMLSRAVS